MLWQLVRMERLLLRPSRSSLRRRIEALWDRLLTGRGQASEEDARMGHLFGLLMVVSTGIVISLTAAFLATFPLGMGSGDTWVAVAFPSAFIPLSIACLVLARRGHLRPAISIYVWSNFAAISAAAWVFDGLRSPAWQLYIWTITIAGTLLTPAYALAMAGGVVAYFFVIFGLQRLGLYRPPLTLGDGLVFIETACQLIMLVAAVGLLTWLNMRSLREALGRLRAEVAERKAMEAEREKLIAELRDSLASVRTLSGLLPICASCKKIRDDQGYWSRVEEYISHRSGARFTHGLCPDCEEKLYRDL